MYVYVCERACVVLDSCSAPLRSRHETKACMHSIQELFDTMESNSVILRATQHYRNALHFICVIMFGNSDIRKFCGQIAIAFRIVLYQNVLNSSGFVLCSFSHRHSSHFWIPLLFLSLCMCLISVVWDCRFLSFKNDCSYHSRAMFCENVLFFLWLLAIAMQLSGKYRKPSSTEPICINEIPKQINWKAVKSW